MNHPETKRYLIVLEVTTVNYHTDLFVLGQDFQFRKQSIRVQSPHSFGAMLKDYHEHMSFVYEADAAAIYEKLVPHLTTILNSLYMRSIVENNTVIHRGARLAIKKIGISDTNYETRISESNHP